MSIFHERGFDPRDLDNHITGHYGEDQFKGQEESDDENPLPFITILQLAEHRGAKQDEHGCIHASEFYRVGLDIMGGCRCTASIAAYNAYPSKSGYWRCPDCMESAGDGYRTVEEANLALFPPEQDEEGGER